MNKPNPGDLIFVDVKDDGSAGQVFHESKGVYKDITADVSADVSQPKQFTIKGKQPAPHIYAGANDWSVTVEDDDESFGGMRRGKVALDMHLSWAY